MAFGVLTYALSAAARDVPSPRAAPDPAKEQAEPGPNAAEARPSRPRARRLPPLPAPSEAQVQALERFQEEAREYEASGRDYRS
ncbi:MAG TPA: hypothetical protein VG963_30560, partial [Polyangiaceae bacterium]|nr:hypothetical protein [Polyangiaceae bacterium]